MALPDNLWLENEEIRSNSQRGIPISPRRIGRESHDLLGKASRL
jgi:hypothetical protein